MVVNPQMFLRIGAGYTAEYQRLITQVVSMDEGDR
jgi:hypothetical protein